jgi:light-regulated signal transduction histidine kinase (bacteriophytochrome)
LGVKREIEQREKIEQLAQHLEVANKGQENLIHIMNHQIKGYFSVAKNIFAELWEGQTYGKMPEKDQPLLENGLKKMNDGVN